jgi:O-methyltransferase
VDRVRTIVILGAGQMGRGAELLLNRKGCRLLAFGDNAAGARSAAGTAPVLPVAAALALAPQLVLIGVASADRGAELEAQARALGYCGSIVRLDALMEAIDIRAAVTRRLAERIEGAGIPGAVAELGVYRGEFAQLLNGLFPGRPLYLFDTFEGFDPRDLADEAARGLSRPADGAEFSDTSAESVLAAMPHPESIILRKGCFPKTAVGIEESFAFASLDADLYAPTLAGLEWFWPRLSVGGCILLHDYGNARFPGVSRAVEDFERERGRLPLVPLGDLHGSAAITRI